MVVALASCTAPLLGPRLVEADGVRYTACGGAMWFRDDGNFKDPATMTYEVLFKDPEGKSHDLKAVHTLNIIDLPQDTSVCRNATAKPQPEK